jgi:nucleoid-associated protein YgaU
VGAAAKLILIAAMVALVCAVQLVEREIASGRGQAPAAATPAAARAALFAPLEEPRLPEVPSAAIGPSGTGAPPALPAGAPAARGERDYVVLPGDTLAKIARKTLGREDAWRAIYERNRAAIADPARLQPGATLRIPAAAASARTPRELTGRGGLR